MKRDILSIILLLLTSIIIHAQDFDGQKDFSEQTQPITIIGVDDSITSAYKVNKFILSNPDKLSINNIEWRLEYETSDGEWVCIKTLRGDDSFDIDPIDNPDNYNITAEGEILGTIYCSFEANGVATELSHQVALELKPYIISITEKR